MLESHSVIQRLKLGQGTKSALTKKEFIADIKIN